MQSSLSMLRVSTSSLVVSSGRWSVWRAAGGVGSIEPSTARTCWWDSPAAFAVRVISQVGAYRKRSAAAFCCYPLPGFGGTPHTWASLKEPIVESANNSKFSGDLCI
jgi:hypothetical protein